jgi:hypothetical protein
MNDAEPPKHQLDVMWWNGKFALIMGPGTAAHAHGADLVVVVTEEGLGLGTGNSNSLLVAEVATTCFKGGEVQTPLRSPTILVRIVDDFASLLGCACAWWWWH